MIHKEFDIRLEEEEEKEKVGFLMKRKFNSFKIHNYFKKSFKHGITLEEVNEIYTQFDKIVCVTKREGIKNNLYCFIYDLGPTKSLYLIFILDEDPPQFFNAYYNHTSQHKKINNRIREWVKKKMLSGDVS